MSLEDIVQDSHLTLSQIHNRRSSSLISQLIDLQNHTVSRKRAEKWVSKLRFLSINDMVEYNKPVRGQNQLTEDSQITHLTERTLRLTDRDEDEDLEYVAVSWRWNSDKTSNKSSGAYRYFVQRPGESRHRTDIPAICLDRVIAFAQAQKVALIWIDKECIYQENEEDKRLGIQAMDLVYSQSKISLGLLMARIKTQWQLDCLSALLDKAVFKDSSRTPRFKRTTDDKLIQGILEVLQIVLSDERWKRCWIFQEDHCSSSRISLLVPCDPSLRKNCAFGDIRGELEISLHLLRITTTMFCKACDARGHPYDDSIIAMVKQYNIWYKIDLDSSKNRLGNKNASPFWTDDNEPFWFQSISLGILSDLEARESQKVADRLAIYANCCKFSSRLDTVSVTRAGYSLSTCILALCLLNGEILRNDENDGPSQGSSHLPDMMDLTVQRFLKQFFLEFNPPGKAYHLSLVQHFRFIDVELTQYGVGTFGWLWTLDEVITLTEDDRNEIEWMSEKYCNVSLDENWLDPVQRCMLWILVRKLNSKGYREFADYLVDFNEEVKRGSEVPSNRFIIKMVEAVLQGIRQSNLLRLGRLGRKVNAIFVCPSSEIQYSDIPMVFTSWSDSGRVGSKKYVSIEVRHDDTSINGAKRLYTRSWINGIWNAKGQHIENYIFPWPFDHSGTTAAS